MERETTLLLDDHVTAAEKRAILATRGSCEESAEGDVEDLVDQVL